jgi:cyclohexyl-isocyanide hydratase
VVAELLDAQTAQSIQLGIEYAPAPPFNAGTPETAPAEVLSIATKNGAASRTAREAIVARVSQRLAEAA